jgi:hypothetical protein
MAVLNAIGRLLRRLQSALYRALATANGPFGSEEWRKGQNPPDDRDELPPER